MPTIDTKGFFRHSGLDSVPVSSEQAPLPQMPAPLERKEDLVKIANTYITLPMCHILS